MKAPYPPRPGLKRDPEEVRRVCRSWGFEAEACDCGYWEPGQIVYCRPGLERRRCHEQAQDRLADFYRGERQAEIRARRRWPGKEPFAGARRGQCWWCGENIMREDGVRLDLRRRRHPDCLVQLLVRIQPDAMRRFVFRRDEGRCCDCGRIHTSLHGHWEADHELALALADGDPAAWAPENVKIRCTDPCHRTKNREDMRRIAEKRRATKEGLPHEEEAHPAGEGGS